MKNDKEELRQKAKDEAEVYRDYLERNYSWKIPQNEISKRSIEYEEAKFRRLSSENTYRE